MTFEDMAVLIRIHFSHHNIKLFDNKRNKKIINGDFKTVKGSGFPPGSPDLLGWRITDGKTVAVKLKTLKSKISKKQMDFLKLMNHDNCITIIAEEMSNGDISLSNFSIPSKTIIHVKKSNLKCHFLFFS